MAFKTGRKRKFLSEGIWENLIEINLKTVGKSGRKNIYASSAGLCSRQTAGLSLLDPDHREYRKASTQFYFKIGNAFEDVMSRAFQKAGIEIDRETRVETMHPDLKVSGRIDFVLEEPDSGAVILAELKTCGKLPTSPKPAHLAQLMTYLVLTGMEKGLIWYVSRSVADWSGVVNQIAFEVEPTEEEKIETLKKITIGAVYAKAGYIPRKPDDMKKYKCGFCPLIPYCWSEAELDFGDAGPAPLDKTVDLLKEAERIAAEVMESQDELKALFLESMAE